MLILPTNHKRRRGSSKPFAKISGLLSQMAKPITLTRGAVVFGPQTPVGSLLILLSGGVRVQDKSDPEDPAPCHHLKAGKTGILIPTCMFSSTPCCAEAIAETDVEVILMPRERFDTLITLSKEFRALVYAAYSQHITDLFLQSQKERPASAEFLRLTEDFSTSRQARNARSEQKKAGQGKVQGRVQGQGARASRHAAQGRLSVAGRLRIPKPARGQNSLCRNRHAHQTRQNPVPIGWLAKQPNIH